MEGLTLRQFQAFLAIVDEGSVTAAARAIGLSQPAISLHLRELERTLAVRLFYRSHGRMAPSEAGQALVAPARRAMLASSDAVLATADYRASSRDRIRIGMGATACIFLLPPVLSAVRVSMPSLLVAVAIGNSSNIVRQVDHGDLDMALVTMPVVVGKAMSVKTILQDPFTALISERLAKPGNSVTPQQLAELPLILYETGGSTRTATDDWFRKASVLPQPLMELGSVEAIKVLVASGLGASVLPSMALRADVPGAVRRKLRPAASRDLAIVTRRDLTLDRGMRLLLSKIEAAGATAADPDKN